MEFDESSPNLCSLKFSSSVRVGHIENGRSFLWMFFVVRTSEHWKSEMNGLVSVILIFNSLVNSYFELSIESRN